jgi:hypothetical protein
MVLLALAACGDNLGSDIDEPDFASSFDGASAVYFGELQRVAPPAPPEPLAGAMVCVEGEEECTTSDEDGVYLVSGPGGDIDSVVVATAPDLLPARVATRPSVTGDRNLGAVPMLTRDTIELRAGDFDVDPELDARGAVLVLAQVFAGGPYTFAIDDGRPPTSTPPAFRIPP